MASSIVPTTAQPHLSQDLIQALVAGVLTSGGDPNFIDGLPDNEQTEDLTKIYLLPYYLEDKPANLGVVRTTDTDPNGETPIRRAQVTIGLRQRDLTPFSAQARADQAAEAILQWARPNGRVRTYLNLDSGRVVLAIKNARQRPEGVDESRRFLATLEFEILYRDINVP